MTEPHAAAAAVADAGDRGGRRWITTDWMIAAALAVAVLVVFGNSVVGDFVYDDDRGIVDNRLVLEARMLPQALVSDVWGFRVTAGRGSNYWRPGFVFFMWLEAQVFGVGSPIPWHLVNLALHIAVVIAAYHLVILVGLARWLAGVIALVFAVHPAHTESVAWISGMPNMLVALPMLLVLNRLIATDFRPRVGGWLICALLYAYAVCSKEVAILFPAIVFLAAWGLASRRSVWRAAGVAAPFAVLAVAYFVARKFILGVSPTAGGVTNLVVVVQTAPAVLAFYLRQIVFPWTLAPAYPLDPILTISVANFWMPLAVVVGAAAVLWIASRDGRGWLARGLLVLPLLPALNVLAFPPDQLVHDRYLYLPLLGFLLIVVPAVARFAARPIMIGAGVAAAAALGAQTIRYNAAWWDDLRLWNWQVRVAPQVAFGHTQRAVFLLEAGEADAARDEAATALTLRPQYNAYLVAADVAIRQVRWRDAEEFARAALALDDRDFRAYDRLAVIFSENYRFYEALEILKTARERMPAQRALITEKIAVVLYNAGRKDEALRELEAVRDAARREVGLQAPMVLFRLGMLYQERHRSSDARPVLEEFLQLTRGATDEQVRAARAAAQRALQRSF